MKLSELLCDIEYTAVSMKDEEISSVEISSRKCKSGSIFVCLRGAKTDGHRYVEDAYSRGCRVFLCDRRVSLPEDGCVIMCSDSRAALAHISSRFFDEPAKKMRIIGITGTKGKTTTSLMVSSILNGSGIPCGYIGSNGVLINGNHIDTVNTTPESLELHRFFKMMTDSGVYTAVIEVSSQALSHHRVEGIDFEVTAFMNLSEDHIGEGEHPDFEDYKNSKARLFSEHNTEFTVYNADDAYSEEMISGASCEKIGFSLHGSGEMNASSPRPYRDEYTLGIDFDLDFQGKSCNVRLRTPGEFSIYNAMAAMSIASHFGITPVQSGKILSQTSVTGRCEIVEGLPGRTFVIDYAHNGMSLTNTLNMLRSYEPSRLICVFGSVGGRTKGRRAELAHASSHLSDLSIITSDNPDFEAPEDIIKDIVDNYDGPAPYTVIVDREEAVREAVHLSEPGDIVLFAGKGHETYQLICGKHVDFSERDIIASECSVIAL